MIRVHSAANQSIANQKPATIAVSSAQNVSNQAIHHFAASRSR